MKSDSFDVVFRVSGLLVLLRLYYVLLYYVDHLALGVARLQLPLLVPRSRLKPSTVVLQLLMRHL